MNYQEAKFRLAELEAEADKTWKHFRSLRGKDGGRPDDPTAYEAAWQTHQKTRKAAQDFEAIFQKAFSDEVRQEKIRAAIAAIG